jgi:hypothetical protein
MGSTKPDMEAKMKGILVVISNATFLYYENLPSLERRSQWFFPISPSIDPLHIPFSIDSTSLETAVGSQSFSKWP